MVTRKRCLIFFILLSLLQQYSEAKPKRNAQTNTARALILGAGIAGLAAAKELENLGYKEYIILEADNRIGGRIREAKFGGLTVEVGANWVHGIKGNPIYDNFIKKYGIKGKISNYDDYIFRNSKGSDVTNDADKAYETLTDAIKKADLLSGQLTAKNMPDISYRKALSLKGWNPSTPVMNAAEYFSFDFEYATSPETISLKNGAFYDNTNAFSGDDFFITDQRGFSHAVREFAAEFLSPGDTRLRLGERVRKIVYGPAGVIVTTNKMTYLAQFGIITFSLGVLRSKELIFEPALPKWKVDTIDQFEMNTYTKIFMKFPASTKRFWDDREYIIYTHPQRGYYTVWQNLEVDGLFPKGTNLLLVTMVGPDAVRISKSTRKQVLDEVTNVLRDMYGNQVPLPEDILIPDWLNDPFTRGSYSNWPLGITSYTFKAMQSPVGALFFAGESCSATFYGYLHGAYYTGIDAAKALVKCSFGVCPKSYKDPNIAPDK